ncbi:MAG TPA: CmcI family methyltransferase, partial [Hyphomicrobiales bacterium]|nr:CmcI family methyltransferase [Hyphomicrobiales bacterium]
MKISIDTDARTLELDETGERRSLDLFSKQAAEQLAHLWVQVGWVRKYSYGYSWLGRPIIQLPDDMIRIQEAIYQIRPGVIVETGIAHGGSLIFYASLFDLIGKGRVIGIDIDIRPHNRAAIEAHPLFDRITLIEGSSIDPEIVARVKSLIAPPEKVMLILASNHARDHVAAELEAYCDLVTSGSYILSQDGVMQQVAGMPRSEPDWDWNNPLSANGAFLENHLEFELAPPPRPFDETLETPDLTHHPKGWMRRK